MPRTDGLALGGRFRVGGPTKTYHNLVGLKRVIDFNPGCSRFYVDEEEAMYLPGV